MQESRTFRRLAYEAGSTDLSVWFWASHQPTQMISSRNPITKPAPVTLSTGTFAGLLGTETLFTIFSDNWQIAQKTERGYQIRRIGWGQSDIWSEARSGPLQPHHHGAPAGCRLGATPAFRHVGAAWCGDLNDQFFMMLSEFYVPTAGLLGSNWPTSTVRI